MKPLTDKDREARDKSFDAGYIAGLKTAALLAAVTAERDELRAALEKIRVALEQYTHAGAQYIPEILQADAIARRALGETK